MFYLFSTALFRFLHLFVLLIVTLTISVTDSVSADFPKEKSLPLSKVLTLNGDTLSLNKICKDKPTFIYFWATWCKQCSKSIKKVIDLKNEFGDEIRVFGIAWKDSAQAIKNYFDQRNELLLSYIDFDGSVFESLKINKTPTVLIVSYDGIIKYQGYGSFRTFKRVVKKQLNK